MTLLVGTEDGLHELDESKGPTGVHLAGHSVQCLAPEGSGWWALTDGEDVWRPGRPGAWDQAATSSGQRLNCLCPTAAGLLVGAEEATLLRLEDEKLEPVNAFEEVPGRDDWYTPWGGPDVRSISEDPGRAIYVNVHVGGVVRSTDGAQTFHPTIDINTDVHQVLAPSDRPGLVLAATGAKGLAVSSDGGDTWTFVIDGLHAAYSRAVAVTATALLASASTGPRGGRAAVYRRPLAGGGPFVRCTEGLPEWFAANIDTFCLAAAGTLAVFGTEEGSVFVSEDEGQTWRVVAEGLPAVRCVAFA
jgi:hypothetical protein